MTSAPTTDVRLAELMAALSIATDLGMGQPLEFASQSCVLALRLAEKLDFSAVELRATYYQALLRYIGCNAETRMLAAIFGDELALRTDIIHQDPSDPKYLAVLIRFIREANAGASPLRMVQAIVGGLVQSGQQIGEFFRGHCEVAGRLAERLGLDAATVAAIQQVYARWDGKGIPPLKGEAIAPGMLVVSLAQDAVYVYRLEGVDAAVALVQKRKGTLYAPKHVEAFTRHAHALFADLDADPSWEAVLALDPGRPDYLSDTEFDAVCAAIADFADIKSPFMLGHSPGVAQLAERAARRCGLPEADIVALRRAALLHDVGRVGVSAGIWVKPGPLSEREWEKVRLHAYHTERILAKPNALAQLGAIASLHHERLDGSGYHRGVAASALPPAARILAAADVYHALTEVRPHRGVRTPEQATDLLKSEAHRGRLDAEVVNNVLAAAGQRVPVKRKELVAGLSEREVEVLRLIARGLSIKQIAEQLIVAPKTVDNHIQHIYAKIGVTTRAGATLFATEQQLL
jgi:HD-GYP domain-containing protein (c-di-GMP phosphodiesterase class II)